MTTIVIVLILSLFIIGFAIADIFWPFTVMLVAAGIAGWWLGKLSTLAFLWHPALIPTYIFIGVLWVFFKWTRLVEEKFRDELRRIDTYSFHKNDTPQAPKWRDHSYDFAAYFFYWPLDMIAYFLSNFLIDCWRFISNSVAKWFDNYAERKFRQLGK